MHMLGHHHVSDDVESVPLSHSFQGADECISRLLCGQQRSAMIAGEGDEMELPGLLISLQAPGHEPRLWLRPPDGCDASTTPAFAKITRKAEPPSRIAPAFAKNAKGWATRPP